MKGLESWQHGTNDCVERANLIKESFKMAINIRKIVDRLS